MTTTNESYVVREHLMDGQYLTADGDWTPCGDSAAEFETRQEADRHNAAHGNGTSRVYVRREGEWDRIAK